MRTAAELGAMRRHPASGSDRTPADPPSAFREFLGALDELRRAEEMHGPHALEVEFARSRLGRARALAVEADRRRRAA